MADFTIEPDAGSLHGCFSASLPPVLTIDPGDRVAFRTLDAGWGLEPLHPDGSAHRHQPRNGERDRGHALCGPVAIRGAEPGMTLTIHIEDIVPGAWGWTSAGGVDSPFNRRLGVHDLAEVVLRWTIDNENGICRDQYGHALPVRPFMGVMGLAPDTAELLSTAPPRPTGGNLDCRELVAGSTLYLPVAVSGGLFSTGDGHAAQADGELSGTAIECPIERVTLRFDLQPDLTITTPRAETPVGWVTFGFDEDLDEAVAVATAAMLDMIGERYGLERREALALASMLVDVRVTQMVNGVRGAHAVLGHDAQRLLHRTTTRST